MSILPVTHRIGIKFVMCICRIIDRLIMIRCGLTKRRPDNDEIVEGALKCRRPLLK